MDQPVYFIREAAEFRLEGGTVMAELRSGDQVIHLAGSVNTLLASFHNAGKLLQEMHDRREAEIIEFPRAAGH